MKRDHLPSLLLLPFPPDPASRIALNAAYRPPLSCALRKLKEASSSQTLIVAVVCPILRGPYLRFKTLPWSKAQSLLAAIYTVISVVCAELDIPAYLSGGPGSVDARVIIIDHGRTTRFLEDFRPAIESNNTAIIDLATFASAYHPWNFIFSGDSEVTNRLYHLYLRLYEGQQHLLQEQLVTVKAGITMNVPPAPGQPALPSSHEVTAYSTVCLGGTFDHLHAGHKLLLTAGAYLLDIPEVGSSKTCSYVIGVTGDELLKDKRDAEVLESWNQRARNVIHFLWTVLELSSQGWKEAQAPVLDEKAGEFNATFRSGTVSVQCVQIQDPFGPTITKEGIEALVVSAETRSGGQAVNDKRAERGWSPLEVFEVDVLDAKDVTEGPTQTGDFTAKISSTAIRRQIAEAVGR